MPKTFVQQKRIQRYLIIAVPIIILVTAFVLWQGFSSDTEAPEGISILPAPARGVKLDTSILSHPIFDVLESPRQPVSIPPNVGRDNPFLPAQ